MDLRHSRVGQLTELVVALSPFLGDGTIFNFEWPDRTELWSLQDGVLLIDGEKWETQPGEGYIVQRPDAPVALLTSATGGVSEMYILVAFGGRTDTRTFGESTGHHTGLWSHLDLPDGSSLDVPSAGHVYDRAGTAYYDRMEPDERILMVPTDSGDAVLHAATSWIGDVAEACVQDADADTSA